MRYVIADLTKALAPADGNHSGSIEPSRSEAMLPSAASAPAYSTHKLRTLALSGLGEPVALPKEVERFARTEPEDPRLRPVPHVVTVEDVTRGLGLESADVQRVQQLVREYGPTGASPSVPSTRSAPARPIDQGRPRLMDGMRRGLSRVAPDTRDEVMRRAQAFWAREDRLANARKPEMRLAGMMGKGLFFIPLGDELVKNQKGIARGGRYYRRVPTGNPERPYRYFYTQAEYEREHGANAHLHGPDVAEERRLSVGPAERRDFVPVVQVHLPEPGAKPIKKALALMNGLPLIDPRFAHIVDSLAVPT